MNALEGAPADVKTMKAGDLIDSQICKPGDKADASCSGDKYHRNHASTAGDNLAATAAARKAANAPATTSIV